MACGDCPCKGGSGATPDFPSASPVADYPLVPGSALNLSVQSGADEIDVAASGGGFSLSSVEWWQWVLVAIAIILLLKGE